jgi:hypothetical protein
MALTALNIAALPLIAGLMAGTGAMGAYVIGPVATPAPASAPASTAATVAAPKTKPCEAQTWPYIENRCVATGAQQNRKVRLVMAPRDGTEPVPEVPGIAPATAPQMDAPAPAAAEKLVTRDTVGRSIEPAAPAATMPQVSPQNSRRAEKRRPREARKLTREAYQVPSEANGRRDTRPVIVVRPLRLDIFR